VKIGPAIAPDIRWNIPIFCRLAQKGAVVTLAIYGVTEPILIIFAHDVATTLPLNISESELL